ncbi:MAG: Trm112 family protein [Burkholderia sp.]|nr:Trm112 family protein [Burkholderia sp.]
MHEHLLEILVCPICKGPISYNSTMKELTCNTDKLAYPIRDGIPVMLVDEARQIIESSSA